MIREYQPSDCRAVVKLFYDAVHAVNAADYTRAQLDAWAPACADLAQWDASLQAHYSLVAWKHGRVLGFGDIAPDGYLDRLYVHPKHLGRGVATAICDQLEASASGKIVVHSSITARPFFEKRGYQMIREQQVQRRGIFLSNYIMEKSL